MKDSSDCKDDSSVLSIVLGTGLSIGILISYLPQVAIIIKNGTSRGLSYVTMWLSFVAGYLTLINAILLQWDTITCAQYLTLGATLASLLPLVQLIVGPLMQYTLYICTVVYFPVKESGLRHYRVAVMFLVVGILMAIALACSVLAMVANVDSDDNALKGYASALGIISAIITIAVWMPQIWTTWKLKDPGSLSIWMLLLQMPGALLVVYFQGIVNGGDWTTWVPYVAQAVQQTVLILLWAWFRITRCRTRRSGSSVDLKDLVGLADEEGNLIRTENGGRVTSEEIRPFLDSDTGSVN